MADEYYLDYQGADSAARRFQRRATDLSGAASGLLPVACLADEALDEAATVLRAFSGRLFAYSDELSMLSTLVDGAVRVTNQVDVDLTLAP